MLYRAVQAKLESVVVELTSTNSEGLLQGSGLVVDAFDNRAARASVSATTPALQLPCLHIGFRPDRLYGRGLWEPPYQVRQEAPRDPCHYQPTRPRARMLPLLQ